MSSKNLLPKSVLALAVLFGGAPALATDLLPTQFGSWSAVASKRLPTATAAARERLILAEYGATGSEQRAYGRAGQTLEAALTRFKDPSGAHGAFTFFRGPHATPARIGDYSATQTGRSLFVVGNFLVEVQGPLADGQELSLLAESLRGVADRRPFPELANRLPEKGLQAGSECYLLGPLALRRFVSLGAGDWIGFEMGAEAEVAEYRRAGDHARLLIIEYPTPQIAYNKLAEISRWFRVNPKDEAGGGLVLYAKRNGSLLGLVTEASSAAYAQELLDAIRYEVKVTWSERKTKLGEPSFQELILSIFVLTGIILLMALGVGLGFGGFRLVVKHFFPRRFFDRPERMEIIQLGLSRKTESLYDE